MFLAFKFLQVIVHGFSLHVGEVNLIVPQPFQQPGILCDLKSGECPELGANNFRFFLNQLLRVSQGIQVH